LLGVRLEDGTYLLSGELDNYHFNTRRYLPYYYGPFVDRKGTRYDIESVVLDAESGFRIGIYTRDQKFVPAQEIDADLTKLELNKSVSQYPVDAGSSVTDAQGVKYPVKYLVVDNDTKQKLGVVTDKGAYVSGTELKQQGYAIDIDRKPPPSPKRRPKAPLPKPFPHQRTN
jgi:hypothetical protein